ncbi:FAD-dependent monooxygenase [uncultured Lacinutrix sp.]|uniref:FAD-dependent monooxygenase n=1 Tax=uncultured Lacinutrix sp. TaxID=574032 RepID=UPI002621CC1B|nr:FAD-dependent monooxygenase [uncultured Lacinutrix sp.]
MYTIIGAGIGGLTTALVFEKLNIEYQLFEKSSGPNAIGAGIWLAPNALQVMEFAGVLDEVINVGNVINRITLTNHKLDIITDSSQLPAKEKYGFSTVAIHRAKLQSVLIDALPKNKIHWNKTVKTIAQLDDTISVTFEDNSKSESRYLIGADGIDSKVRSFIFPEAKIRYSGQTCWRGVMEEALPIEYQERGIEMWGQGIRFGMSQISKSKTYWFAVQKSKAFGKDDKRTLKKKLLNDYKAFHPLVNTIINNTNTETILRNDITDLKPIKHWHKGNICLIGDAAHATTPNMGQGGAQAIEDAYYLGRLIAENSNKNIFKAFYIKRYKKANAITSKSWLMGKIAHYNKAASIRNLLFKNIPKSVLDKTMHAVYELNE